MGYIEKGLPAGHPQGENPPRLYVSDEDMEQFEAGEVTLSRLEDRYNTGQRDEWDELLIHKIMKKQYIIWALIGMGLLASMSSCSDKLCPAYTYIPHTTRR